MTKKRFTYLDASGNKCIGSFFCNDNILTNEEVVVLLNENEQLKFQLQNTCDQRDEFHRGARENANRVGKLEKENEKLKKENKHLRCTIESNNQDDYIDYLEKQNERLKERITEVASLDKIVFMK